eukprot:GHVU01035834.1.p1 GENE.GHVU01035834.1~~GHVU01035834.1.p1  ORF type:complete len:288 (+),score=70.11 GHVU01035834.1:105-968(+)
MRTVGLKRIWKLQEHAARLVQSAKEARSRQDIPAAQQAAFDANANESTILAKVKQDAAALLSFMTHGSPELRQLLSHELFFIPLLSWTDLEQTDQGFDLWMLAVPLPVHQPEVQVEVRPGIREHPTAKSTQWVSARKPLEALRLAESNEVVIAAPESGEIAEGLNSNFYALKGDVLYTAPASRVLAGTVRRSVLEKAGEVGLGIVEECPRVSEAHTWDGCFITSSSRAVLPVKRLLIFPSTSASTASNEEEGAKGEPSSVDFSRFDKLRRLNDLILKQMLEESTLIE